MKMFCLLSLPLFLTLTLFRNIKKEKILHDFEEGEQRNTKKEEKTFNIRGNILLKIFILVSGFHNNFGVILREESGGLQC